MNPERKVLPRGGRGRDRPGRHDRGRGAEAVNPGSSRSTACEGASRLGTVRCTENRRWGHAGLNGTRRGAVAKGTAGAYRRRGNAIRGNAAPGKGTAPGLYTATDGKPARDDEKLAQIKVQIDKPAGWTPRAVSFNPRNLTTFTFEEEIARVSSGHGRGPKETGGGLRRWKAERWN